MSSGVGILAFEVYFPRNYILQEDLEQANGVSKGKYTIGLGQDAMAFTGDLEDINSIALTVVQSLLEKYSISPLEVGRLEVGTESLVDKSKSTKTVLMSLFEGSGNTDIEGLTVVNACYGGTAALLNALTWVDSSSWDGRYAIVVAADIAVYADGPARPTGGCGSVAMLIGRNAPLQIDLRTRVCHASHVWDFFKPNLDSEYPEVNGSLSQTCYLRALDDCYTRFVSKSSASNGSKISVKEVDHFLFHSPYNKLVQKSFGRLIYLDAISGSSSEEAVALSKWQSVPPSETYEDKELETALKSLTGPLYASKVAPACEVSKQIGNTYTASVYMNLANLVSLHGEELVGKKVILFSYGSGALASMFSIIPSNSSGGGGGRFSLEKMQKALDISSRLSQRVKNTPSDLTAALDAREKSHGFVPFKPTFSLDTLAEGAFFIDQINSAYERIYKRKSDISVEIAIRKSLSFADDFGVGISLDDVTPSQEDDNPTVAFERVTLEENNKWWSSDVTIKESLNSSPKLSIPRNKTYVWASGRPNVHVVITGVAAALPGRDQQVFKKGENNVMRIINGEMFISPIPDSVKDAMIEKNVIELKKNKDGSTSKVYIKNYLQQINVCASIGSFDLSQYGVAASIVTTMDRAVQVAIAAGLEALKDARIVTGEGEGTTGWELPVAMQNTTGIVYATSFPALDAAIAEVSKFYNSKTINGLNIPSIVKGLRSRLETTVGQLSPESEAALAHIEALSLEAAALEKPMPEYEFDRKFLFRVLVLGNAQLAQIIKAKGPNMQTNAACAG